MSLYLIPYVGSPEAREQRAALRRRAAEKEAKRLAAEARTEKQRLEAIQRELDKAAVLAARREAAAEIEASRDPYKIDEVPTGTTLTGHQVIRHIIREVSKYYGLSVIDLLSYRRDAVVSNPRHVAIWLAKKRTAYSLPKIGEKFNRTCHTTILHAVRQVEKKRKENKRFADELDKILARIPLPTYYIHSESTEE